jgi:integrase
MGLTIPVTIPDGRKVHYSMKPSKPYPDFPLTANGNGQWSKKIRGKVHYFGVWADWQAALNRYLEQRDYLHTGQVPPTETAALGNLLDLFLEGKDQKLQAGEINQTTYNEYQTTADTIADTLGPRTSIESLTPAHFGLLRTALGKGKNGPYSPATFKKRLQIARMVFALANEEHGFSLKYKKKLEAPPKILIRKHERLRGEQFYTAEQIRKLVKAADPDMRAMILLGINCGFGPKDCCTLPANQVNLASGWHDYWRTKTQVDRRCPLWPETVAALREVIGSPLVFNGRNWNRHVVARKFKKLAVSCDVPDFGFYSLKRTLETVATSADVNQAVIDHAIGHARHDMASIYRQKIFDQQLLKFSNHVRDWYLGRITLE